MELADLLTQLQSQDIRLWLETDQDGVEKLRYSAPPGALTAELRAAIGAQRPAIVEYLRRNAPLAAAPITLRPRSSEQPAPLSFAQQRLWFLEQLEPGKAVYHIGESYWLEGALDIPALERSLQQIIERHTSLRTVFHMQDQAPVQQLLPAEDWRLEMVQGDASDETANLLAEGLLRTPFDLGCDYMLRARLVRQTKQRHLLVLVIHHIAFDGWSQPLFWKELSLCYTANSQGLQPDLPQLPVSYADYSVWQRAWLSGATLEGQAEYWLKKLDGLPDLELPADLQRPAELSYQGGVLDFTLPPGLQDPLKTLALSSRATPFMVGLALTAAFLGRYSGQEDFAIGSPIANRNQAEIQDLIGFFVNTLVLRMDLSSDPSLRQLLLRVRQTCLEAYEHQDLPFEKLVELVNPERQPNRSPLYQALFQIHGALAESDRLLGLRSQSLRLSSGAAKTDLYLALSIPAEGDPLKNAIAVRMVYSKDLFSPEAAGRLARHYANLLQAALQNPDLPLSRLPLMDAEERQQALYAWNQTRRDYPRQASLAQLFAAQAAQHPQHTALEFDGPSGETIPYETLNRRANQLAHMLRQHGAQRGARVAFALERSGRVPWVMLAIIKAGASYVPLDPGYPAGRLRFMLEDSGAALLVSEGSLLPAWALDPSGASLVPVLDLDAQAAQIAAQPEADLPDQANGEDLAYVMYTSGSTGQPKGSAIPQRAVARLVINTNYVQLGAGDRVAQVSNISFDAATFEVWGALLNGACLVGLGRDELLDPAGFGQTLRHKRIHSMFLTTSLFNTIAAQDPAAFNSLRDLLVGGEALTPEYIRRVLQTGGPQRLLNAYGPTESTTFAVCHPITEVPEGARSIPIGLPIANTTAYVLDAHYEPLPPGLTGELYLGGDGLAQGYWQRDELTLERFVPDPFSAQDGEPLPRLYRTGDLARRLADGTIDFIGRRDTQVKLRGFRIELGEIETALLDHPAVANAAVLLRRAESAVAPAEKFLAAYLVLRGPTPHPNRQELAAFLRQRLPEYMLPAAFVTLPALPLTPNGKLDTAALPVPETIGVVDNPVEVPLSPEEARLGELWLELLRVSRVHPQDNFFELGGHSLLAIRLFARIEEIFGQRLPLSLLFADPTLAGLARHLHQVAGEIPDLAAPSAPAAWNPLALIRPAALAPMPGLSSQSPLFIVHGYGGGTIGYTHLAQLLPPGVAVYGLQAAGLQDGGEPDTSIPQMAQRYLAALRQVQPHGPYRLAGYCIGGVIAFEMAGQLEEQGEPVSLVGIIEGYAPYQFQENTPVFHPRRLAEILRNLPFWFQDYTQMNRAQLTNRLRIFWQRFVLGRRMEAHPQDYTPDDLTEAPERLVRLMTVHIQAQSKYQPRPVRAQVALFRARHIGIRQTLVGGDDPLNGWGRLTNGGVRLHVVEGSHRNLHLPPHVPSLALALSQELAEDSR